MSSKNNNCRLLFPELLAGRKTKYLVQWGIAGFKFFQDTNFKF